VPAADTLPAFFVAARWNFLRHPRYNLGERKDNLDQQSKFALIAMVGMAMLLTTACPNPTNRPPTASFYDLQATGANPVAVAGYYRENGANELRPKYDQVGGSYFVYFFTSTDFGAKWTIHDTVFASLTNSLLDAPFYNGASSPTAPTGTWSLAGVLGIQAPTVQRVAITGTLTAPSPLTGTYNYSDPDGDLQGASLYQWYSFGSSTATSGGAVCAGAGAATLSYTLDATDSGRYLRLQVTPVDVRGAAGAVVLSGAVKIN